jgi:hypothetical protein
MRDRIAEIKTPERNPRERFRGTEDDLERDQAPSPMLLLL